MTVAVNTVALRVSPSGGDAHDENEDDKMVVESLASTLNRWFGRVRDWVEVCTNQDLDLRWSPPRFGVIGQDLFAWKVVDGRPDPFRRRNVLSFDFAERTPLTNRAWRHILVRVSEGERPVDEQLLLRDARAAFRREKHRLAVIDGGTVIEMTLWRLLQSACRSGPSALGDLMLETAERWTLGRLLGAVAKLVALPPSLNQNVVAVRNATVHRQAERPTPASARQCVEAAAAMVDLVVPLPRELRLS